MQYRVSNIYKYKISNNNTMKTGTFSQINTSDKLINWAAMLSWDHPFPQTRTCSGAQEKNSKCVITSGAVATNVNFLWPGFNENQMQVEASKLNQCWEETFSQDFLAVGTLGYDVHILEGKQDKCQLLL